jgi:ATP-binding cassette subfamily B protein
MLKGLKTEYETMLGERGIYFVWKVKKQRVAIAQHLLKIQKFLYLMIALALQTPKPKQKFWKTLKLLVKIKTIITVSHRPSSLKDCDYIIVLDEGAVIEERVPMTSLVVTNKGCTKKYLINN